MLIISYINYGEIQLHQNYKHQNYKTQKDIKLQNTEDNTQ